MIFDDLGGATPGTAKTIKGLAKNASGEGARDATDYGETHTGLGLDRVVDFFVGTTCSLPIWPF
jgi:hypothetical protein